MLKFNYDDGGRSKYFKGHAGDCVVRAFAIASKTDYKAVYDYAKSFKLASEKSFSPRDGVSSLKIDYIASMFGFEPIEIDEDSLFQIQVQLQNFKIILASEDHLRAMINGVINDTHNKECVYTHIWVKQEDKQSIETIIETAMYGEDEEYITEGVYGGLGITKKYMREVSALSDEPCGIYGD